MSPPAPHHPPPRLVPLTAFPGFERSPSFSPDGRQVVFSWNGPGEDNYDIYLMVVGTTTAVRLTTDPAQDVHPVWSPDGRQIAFVRLTPTPVVMLMPPLGGSERRLAETGVAHSVSDWLPSGTGIDWSPDGTYLALAASDAADRPARIVLVSPDTGERRAMTNPPAGRFGDGMPRFSPDGRKLAFLRQRPDLHWDLCIIALPDQGAAPPFIHPAFKNAWMPAFAWARDSRELVGPFVYEEWESQMWRMPADGHAPPARVAGASGSATDVAVAAQGGHLAYASSVQDPNIWRIEVNPGRSPDAEVRLIASTSWDGTPEYSPDGRRILLGSTRSGYTEVWVCDSDGSNATRLTHMDGPETGSARWSPDGRTIAFDSWLDGQPEIYVITADGGPPRRLTNDPATDFVPTWSRDGGWIYFTSDRSGTRQLWKMPAGGGAAVQVTKHGGVHAFEAEDGRTLYYSKDIEATGLWKMPVAGGEEVQVLDVPEPRRWGAVAYGAGGVYYMAREPEARRPFTWTIFFYEFASKKVTRIAPIDKPLGYFARSLALSPDGRWLLFSQVDTSGSDLMLLENFR